MHILKLAMYPLAVLYGGVVFIRNFLYNHNLLHNCTPAARVICVGNLSTGGTGKSPMVKYLAVLSGLTSTAVLSRGYGRSSRGFREVQRCDTAALAGDEPLMIKQALTDLHVFVGENRCQAAGKILSVFPKVTTLILDDAFQHRKIKAGLNILLTRYDNPFWKDYLLPTGHLREGPNGAARAQVVMITQCPAAISKEEQKALTLRCQRYTRASVFFSTLQYGTPQPVWEAGALPLQVQSALCVSGIAHPEPFVSKAAGMFSSVEVMNFPDHHAFREMDIKRILSSYHSLKSPAVIITTEKDRARMVNDERCLKMLMHLPVYWLPVEFTILGGSNRFDQLVSDYVAVHS